MAKGELRELPTPGVVWLAKSGVPPDEGEVEAREENDEEEAEARRKRLPSGLPARDEGGGRKNPDLLEDTAARLLRDTEILRHIVPTSPPSSPILSHPLAYSAQMQEENRESKGDSTQENGLFHFIVR